MSPGFEVEPPDLSEIAELRPCGPDLLVDAGLVETSLLIGESAAPVCARGLAMLASIVRVGSLAASVLPSVRLTDVRFEGADLASAAWVDARAVRAVFTGCRLTGIDLRGAEMRDVRFTDCKAPDMVMHEASCTRVLFEDSRVTGLDLSGGRIESLSLRGCDARNLRLLGARIVVLDLRSSLIDGIALDPTRLGGIVIDPTQAPALAAALGVRVLDAE